MLKEKLRTFSNFVVKVLSSQWFFWVVVAYFVYEALWIAISFKYPMLFDEGYHFGLIKIFAHNPWPFMGDQPPQYDVYRDIAHEGSYLFHYLMSYPYKLINLVTTDHMQQIVSLRVINIALFGWGLVLYRRLMQKLNIRQIFINISLLFFILLPLVPFVAATINYDNLLFPLTVLFLLVGVDIVQAKKPQALSYAYLILITLFASLVKFTFLPIAAAGVVFIAVCVVRNKPKRFLKDIKLSAGKVSKPMRIALCVLFVVLGAWFVQIYGQNLIKYGTVRPQCARSLSKERCMASAVIQRNTALVATRDQRQLLPPTDFAFRWLEAMFTLLAITGKHTPEGIKAHTYMPVSSLTLFGIMIAGSIGLVYSWKDRFNSRKYYFLVTIFLFYSAVLFVQNLSSYIRYHEFVAVQPRYLLAFVPLVAVMMVVGVSHMTAPLSKTFKAVGFLMIFLAYFNFSGLTLHIMRSEPEWYWQNETVIKTNDVARRVLNKIVIERF